MSIQAQPRHDHRPAPPRADPGEGLLRWVDADLRPELDRVTARLLLPGEELAGSTPRAGLVVARILALAEDEVERLAAKLLADFAGRHDHYRQTLAQHADAVSGYLPPETPLASLSEARLVVLGATFTAELTLEGAALCNPSAVPHPDQAGLRPGQLRMAISLRAISEGHISAIEFAEAVIGPGEEFAFLPRQRPTVSGRLGGARWRGDHLRALLDHTRQSSTLSNWVLGNLPATFTGADVETAMADAPLRVVGRAEVAEVIENFRRVVHSNYLVEFPDEAALSQQVLLPALPEESNGMEDARFTLFRDEDGSLQYRGTYTAYDGRTVMPRMLASSDLETFTSYRLAGPAARNKGMALFPRAIGGRQWALCRVDGESLSLSGSDDGLTWDQATPLQQPELSWEVLQIGNCGSPLETDRGWLVLTHGVGPMRVYVLGALLLDLDDPTRVIGHLPEPLLAGGPAEQDGYVPNVIYSCGGLLHDGRLWVPCGIGDERIGVAFAEVDAVLDAMAPTGL